jgi:hypothetical protein
MNTNEILNSVKEDQTEEPKQELMRPLGLGQQIEFTGRLFDYKEFRKYSDTFIETGNAAGDGLQRALDAGFKLVWGIEASDYYYQMCRARFRGDMHVTLLLGNSTKVLQRIIFHEQSVFYLDAHVSGDTSFGYEEWVRDGENGPTSQDNIIKAELAIILANYNKHVIIIDDVNGLKDWHAYDYMELCLAANTEYKFQFFNEQLDKNGPLYIDKLLVCVP